MAAYTRGCQSCTSIVFGQTNLATNDNSLLPVRCGNVEQTLRDLELMKNKKCRKIKSTSNIKFSFPTERRYSKTVRFENIYENNDGVRETCSEEQIHVPFDGQCMNGGYLRKSQSEARCQSKRLSNQNIQKHRRLAGETGTKNLFHKLKKFWQGLGVKQRHKKQSTLEGCTFNEDSDSRFSVSNNSCDSFTESIESETSGYVTSKARGRNEFLKSSASEDSIGSSCEDLRNRQQTYSHCAQIENFENSDHHLEQLSMPRINEKDCCSDVTRKKDMSFNTLRTFWEPRNGLNDEISTKENDCDACIFKNNGLEDKTLNSSAHMHMEKRNGLEYKTEKQAFQAFNLQSDVSQHSLWKEFGVKTQCQPDDVSPKTSTETLVETSHFDHPSYLPLSSQESKGAGFLNYKTSPICCSLHSNSISCKESESDIKKTIRCLKKAMKLRKKMQKLELKQLKEEMRHLKSGSSRKSNSSKTSSCTFSSATANCGSLGNLLAGSRSSYSEPACSLVSTSSSEKQFRTVLNGPPCLSVPKLPYLNCSQSIPKSAPLKQQFSLRNPVCSQPILAQTRPNMKNCTYISQTACFERPKMIYSQAQKSTPCYNFDLTQELNRSEPKANNSSCDPTKLLWNEILLNTPCNVSNANESLITCYVGMYRKQAAEALKNNKGCVIDPLEFRYGYQNEKHSNGPVNIVKKGDAQVVWNCRTYGKRRGNRVRE